MRTLRPATLALACTAMLACGGDDATGGDGSSDGSGGSGSSGDASSATTASTTMTTTPSETSASGSSSETSEATTAPADSSSGEASSSSGAGGCAGMTFFATSSGSGGNGGDLGGLAGADATCQALAEAVGQGGCTWHAYLSSSEADARDRIGAGPWFNANGDMIAADVDALHTDGLSNGDPQHVLDEHGAEVPGPEHDILTGSQEDGTLLAGATCDDWNDGTDAFVARVGHSDIPDNPNFSPSWNSAHDTPGCRPQDLEQVGGAGRLYCFAID